MNHGLFVPIEKIKKYTGQLDSKKSSSPTPSSSFLSCKSNKSSPKPRENVILDLTKSKYATILSTTNPVIANQENSLFSHENNTVEQINSLLGKEIIKNNEQTNSLNKLKSSVSAGRSKSIPQKLLNSDKKKFAKSSQSDIYKSILLNQQSKMILNKLSSEKRVANSNENDALNNLNNLITYSSSSSASSSSSTSMSTSSSNSYTGKKAPETSTSKKTSLLSLKNFHIKIPKFSNSSNNNASTESVKTMTTSLLGNTKVEDSRVNNEEKISTNIVIAKEKDSTGRL